MGANGIIHVMTTHADRRRNLWGLNLLAPR
jgi:hypothetical protein